MLKVIETKKKDWVSIRKSESEVKKMMMMILGAAESCRRRRRRRLDPVFFVASKFDEDFKKKNSYIFCVCHFLAVTNRSEIFEAFLIKNENFKLPKSMRLFLYPILLFCVRKI